MEIGYIKSPELSTEEVIPEPAAPAKKDFLSLRGLLMGGELFEDKRISANAVVLALP